MEPLQAQITTLAHKVDLVYEILDRLYHDITENVDNPAIRSGALSVERARNLEDAKRFERGARRRNYSDASNNYRSNGYPDLANGANSSQAQADWAIAQQDILIDSSGVEISHYQIKEQDLSPQVQIQRLTAQLTAAYTRIAALEEQLLAKRWK
jgi:hypothetical protein